MIKLTKDARIITTDGKDIGNLNRFVIDPISKKVTHIVFEHGLLDRVEYLIPFELVQNADEQGIHLRPLPVDEIIELPRFDLDNYIITNESALLERGYVSDEMVQGYYYYPPVPGGMEGILRPDDMYIYNAPESGTTATQVGSPGGADAPVQKETNTNIPDGTVAIQEGAKVISSDEKHVGDVEKLLVDPQSARATHILITKGMFNKEKKLIPTDWVKDTGEKEVYLSIPERFIDELPEYKEK